MSIETGIVTGDSLVVPKPSISTDNHGNPAFNRPITIFSDFDGTIFEQDTGHVLFDNFGCGKARREEIDGKIGSGELTFRGGSELMYNSLNVTLEEGVKKLKETLTMDKAFKQFFDYTVEHRIPFNVISAGLKPLLRSALDTFLGPEKSAKIGIVSNEADISPDGSKWTVKWRHDSELGHDKAQSIIEYKRSVDGEIPLIVFIGDGISDLAAASQADILFARQGYALEKYCIKNKIPYIPYMSFADIQTELEQLVNGNPYHDEEAKKAAAANTSSSAPTNNKASNAAFAPNGIPAHILNSTAPSSTPTAELPAFLRSTSAAKVPVDTSKAPTKTAHVGVVN